ncbi:chemotaxis protein CheC [Methanocella sp. CWC-04]|uniref:Chemotaxis protein CheC n=1 Tax=Methanooceanicella nereidis TaxID=2052831 RepID=A0AAP2RAV5_9EURY|nr:chemotaxis protein CheC [Methanocella sp. CWC-04]MCD1294166.1 chemotaxis protein CheC [Methanocella sp. CWC-04]
MNGTSIELTEFQKDALKEFGNIGSAHAATSLSQMMGRGIEMKVPDIELAPLSKILTFIDPDEPVAGLYFQLMDGESNTGHIYLLFPEQSAYAISDILMGMELGTTMSITDMEMSALMEVGNILVSTFSDASAGLLGITMLPSPPAYSFDMARSLIEKILLDIGRMSSNAIIFKTSLSDESNCVNGYLLLLPNPETLEKILDILGSKVNG